MQPSDSTAVLALAATYENSTLCLLEQIMPDFPNHSAYVDTMMEHFDKRVRTPLWGTLAAPTLRDKHTLLRRQGWKRVEIKTLKEFWYSEEERERRARALSIEVFDEWYVYSHRALIQFGKS
jgi:hypothetical protein